MLFDAKMQILNNNLASEVLRLSLDAKRIADANANTRDYTQDVIARALKETLAWFPVYRTYVTEKDFDKEDRVYIDWAVLRAKKHTELADPTVYDFIGSLLALEILPKTTTMLEFVRRFQQLSGPAMAKGLEDTSFYRYNRLLSLNEVGGTPTRFGITIKNFHKIIEQRVATMPHSMIGSSTHDTKRGEDTRARLSVLSEMPFEWGRFVTRWSRFNRSFIKEIDGQSVPSRNQEYYLYQTLLGSWPVEFLQGDMPKSDLSVYLERLKEFITKYLREEKLHTSWATPNEDYENAVFSFVEAILNPERVNPFLDDFKPFAASLASLGMNTSLSQTILKLTLPGVPDIYQGDEYWDYSLVDPDNRRPVDYARREKSIGKTNWDNLLKNWQDGVIKQNVIHTLLNFRNGNKELFDDGDYQPIEIAQDKENWVAFSRNLPGKTIIIVLPIRGTYALTDLNALLTLPSGHFVNLFTNDKIINEKQIDVASLRQSLPFAVLISA